MAKRKKEEIILQTPPVLFQETQNIISAIRAKIDGDLGIRQKPHYYGRCSGIL